MKKLNFITTEDLNTTSGGWSGINWNIYHQLNKYFKIQYVGPISPPMDFKEKLYSKLLRSIGLKGNFAFFSNKRLSKINSLVLKDKNNNSDYNFFFGQTPWIECNYEVQYGVYLDADFFTYLSIFSNPEPFRKKDIKRITSKEERWLQGARDIFVGSQWAWDEMNKYYKLNEDQKVVVHTGGNVDLPEKDEYAGGLNLVFISLNFEKKGGFVCVDAYKEVKKKFPKLTLSIIGEKPPSNILEIEGIVYEGLLRKTNKEELIKFKDILSKAFLLIHPTKMDTMGAVLIESGYFGCPSIAPKSFGIPELVLNDKTGYVLNLPFDYLNFAEKIELLIKDKNRYLNMREKAWHFTRSELTWAHIGDKIKKAIQK